MKTHLKSRVDVIQSIENLMQKNLKTYVNQKLRELEISQKLAQFPLEDLLRE